MLNSFGNPFKKPSRKRSFNENALAGMEFV